MTAIHFVEKIDKYLQVDEKENEWESGHWVVSIDAAAQLIGGDIYLHRGQKEPSFIGGVITGFRVTQRDKGQKITFRFKRMESHEGLITESEGWGNEQKRTGF